MERALKRTPYYFIAKQENTYIFGRSREEDVFIYEHVRLKEENENILISFSRYSSDGFEEVLPVSERNLKTILKEINRFVYGKKEKPIIFKNLQNDGVIYESEKENVIISKITKKEKLFFISNVTEYKIVKKSENKPAFVDWKKIKDLI